MTDASKQILKSAKCARVIACISDMFHVSLQEATDIYYESETADSFSEEDVDEAIHDLTDCGEILIIKEFEGR